MRIPHRILATRILALGAILAALLPCAALAQEISVTVSGLWSYPAASAAAISGGGYNLRPPGNAIDIYGSFANDGGVNDALTGITSPAGSSAKIVIWVRGVLDEIALPLELPRDKPIVLGPDTQFLRLYGASKSYANGDSFPITFHFRHSADVTTNVAVKNPPPPGTVSPYNLPKAPAGSSGY